MTKTQRWVRHLAWEPQKKRHLQFITQGRALVSRVTTPLPCNQSIDQWINEHDNAQSDLLARPSFKKLRRYSDLHGGEKRMDCRNQTRSRKVFQTKIRQQKKKLCNNTQREHNAQYIAKVPTLHRLCYSLLLLADCQPTIPPPHALIADLQLQMKCSLWSCPSSSENEGSN